MSCRLKTISIVEANEVAPTLSGLPICVDLDGTLVCTDLLVEGVLALGCGPHFGRALPTLLSGRAAFKAFVANTISFDPAFLPYNNRLIAWLKAQKANGRQIILTTAADFRIARAVADHVGLFDDVIASDGTYNNKAAAKAEILVQRFGRGAFTYVGNSRSDLAVWQMAGSGVIVNASRAVTVSARRLIPIEAEIDERASLLRAALRALRPYQWVKNILVFVPIFTAHAFNEMSAWAAAAIMFVAFCATASGIYLLNDLSDLNSDRSHSRKRFRPLASGDLPVTIGFVLALVLIAFGFAVAAAIDALLVILTYAAMSLSYSVKLKEMPLIDVFVLAGFYTIRLVAGGEVTGHFLSVWLLAFSGFIFLSLALVKRVEELLEIDRASQHRISRRGYSTSDVSILTMFGCCSSFASCLVLTLYVQAEATAVHFTSPTLLWGTVPLVLFWQCRLWLATARGYMHDDPIIYAAGDWVSWIVAALSLAIVIAASSRFAIGL